MPKKRRTPAQKRRARRKAKEKARLRKQTASLNEKGKKVKRRKKKENTSSKPKKPSIIGTLVMYSFVFFVAVIAGIYAFQGFLLNYGFQEGKGHLVKFAQKAGITISEIDAKDLSLAGTEGIQFGSFSTVMELPNKKELSLSLQENKATFDFKLDIFNLKGSQFHIQITDPYNEKSKPMVFKGTKLRLDAPVDRQAPQESIQNIIKQFQKILDTGSTPLKVAMKGTLAMEYNGEPRDVAIRTYREDDVTFLQMEKESLLSIIGEDSASDLTDAEIQVLADYPLRAAKLLRIQKYAKKKAAQYAVQKDFPEDAFRHILWNYKITLAYDAPFAKKFTDAHEIGALNGSGKGLVSKP